MAIKSPSQLYTQINTDLADNTSGAILPVHVRTAITDAFDSAASVHVASTTEAVKPGWMVRASDDNTVFINATGSAITPTGTTAATLNADGLTPLSGGANSASTATLVSTGLVVPPGGLVYDSAGNYYVNPTTGPITIPAPGDQAAIIGAGLRQLVANSATVNLVGETIYSDVIATPAASYDIPLSSSYDIIEIYYACPPAGALFELGAKLSADNGSTFTTSYYRGGMETISGSIFTGYLSFIRAGKTANTQDGVFGHLMIANHADASTRTIVRSMYSAPYYISTLDGSSTDLQKDNLLRLYMATGASQLPSGFKVAAIGRTL